jgi:hypothetical protein
VVVSLIVTVCEEVYAPATGVNVGVAAVFFEDPPQPAIKSSPASIATGTAGHLPLVVCRIRNIKPPLFGFMIAHPFMDIEIAMLCNERSQERAPLIRSLDTALAKLMRRLL